MYYGDIVRCEGRLYRITGAKLGGIAGPHYRLAPLGDYPAEGLTSHHIVTLVVTVECQHEERTLSRTCGVPVCDECKDHEGLVQCFCGWAVGGGSGHSPARPASESAGGS